MGFSLGDIGKAVGGFLGFKAEEKQSKEVEKAAKRQAEEEARVAEDNRQISLYDASVMEKDAVAAENAAAFKLQNHIRAADALLGKATARLGKAGVVVSSGSALDKQVDIIHEAQREADIIIHDGKTARDRRLSAAERYYMLAEKGLRDAAAHGSILESAAAAESTQHKYASYGALISSADSFSELFKGSTGKEGWLNQAFTSIGTWFQGA